MSTQPNSIQSVYDVFTFYLKADHLKDQARTVTVDSVSILPVFNPGLNKNVDSVVMHFSDARRSLKLNKTQCEALMQITGSDDFVKWSGMKVILTPARSKSGKNTIAISKA